MNNNWHRQPGYLIAVVMAAWLTMALVTLVTGCVTHGAVFEERIVETRDDGTVVETVTVIKGQVGALGGSSIAKAGTNVDYSGSDWTLGFANSSEDVQSAQLPVDALPYIGQMIGAMQPTPKPKPGVVPVPVPVPAPAPQSNMGPLVDRLQERWNDGK